MCDRFVALTPIPVPKAQLAPIRTHDKTPPSPGCASASTPSIHAAKRVMLGLDLPNLVAFETDLNLAHVAGGGYANRAKP
jgi:hypothetical protein